MKKGNVYHHFKGNDYEFIGVALPIISGNEQKFSFTAQDAHTPDGEEIKTVFVFEFHGYLTIDREVPHVIYRSKKDKSHWARRVDDFFGYKKINGELIKRFFTYE